MVKSRQAAPRPIVPVAWQPRRRVDEVEIQRLSELARRVPKGVAERMEFHVFVLYVSGGRSHEVDFERHRCPPGTLVHVRPGEVHRFALSPEVSGFALLVSPTFLSSKPAHGDLWHAGFFDEVSWPAALRFEREDAAAIRGALGRLGDVLASHTEGALELSRLRHLLAATLLDVACRAGLRKESRLPRPDEASRVRAFRAAIERSFRVTRNVEDYARALGCAARTLDRAAHTILGHSAKAAIDARVVLEAKRMLAHDTASAASIGESLGFSEPTNFAKFFRSRTGAGPGAFRALYHPKR